MRLILTWIILFLSASLAVAQGVRPPMEKPFLVAPIIIDNKIVTEAWIFPREDKSQFSIDATQLTKILDSILLDDRNAELKRRVNDKGVLSLKDLEAVGLTPRFEASSLEFYLEVPLRLRKSSNLDLNYVEIGGERVVRPSAQSGYFNFRTMQSYQYGSAVTNEKLPLTGHFDLVENINGIVFESMAEYFEHNQYPVKRMDTRLRTDNEEKLIRYTLGDLSLSARGFQQSPNIAGLAVTKEFSIQPYKTLRPLSTTEIVLQRTSVVEIYVNGFLYSQLRLPPGVFNIRDFPLALGQNNVKVKVKDDLGQSETYDFSILFENTLLGKGVHEFSYAAGIPWTESGADRAYDDKAGLGYFFHRYGFTDQITLGLNFQNYLGAALTGGEISTISSWGYFAFEGAYATTDSQEEGFAQRFRYRSLDRMFGENVPLVWTVEVENRDPQFQPLILNTFNSVDYLRRYDAQVNYRFANSVLAGAGVGTIEVAQGEDQRTYRSNVVFPIAQRTRVELSYIKTLDEEDKDRGLISLYWSEEQGRFSASSYYDSLQKSANISLNKNNLDRFDDSRWSANIQGQEDTRSASLAAEYLLQPAILRFEHFSSSQPSGDSHISGFGINSGFAWVGTQGTFTQPIYDSFTLVKVDQLPQDKELYINPNGKKGDARLGPNTSVVLREQAAYYKYGVSLDSTSLPVGYLLDKEFFSVQPTYRSGILLTANLKKRVLVKGRLLNAHGEPRAYLAGDILNAQGQLVDNTFFTNKEGGFFIEGLEPGLYTISTDKADLQQIEIEVVDVPGNALNLGNIVVKDGEAE